MKRIISVMMSIAMVMMCGAVLAAGGITIDTSATALNTTMSKVVGLVKTIAVAFAIGMLLYVGIKYVMASANEKADLKKGSISYVIGAIIIFGATGLISIAQNLGTQVAGSGS